MARPRGPGAEQILSAAEELFSEQGFGETSLRGLIDRAGVSPTVFYLRFHSRDAVLEALVDRLLTALYLEAAKASAEAATLEAGLEQGIAAVVKVLAAHRVVVRLALTEAKAIAPLRTKLGDAYRRFAELVSARLVSLAKRGRIRTTDAEMLGWALVGALVMQVERWAVFEELSRSKLQDALLRITQALVPAAEKTKGKR